MASICRLQKSLLKLLTSGGTPCYHRFANVNICHCQAVHFVRNYIFVFQNRHFHFSFICLFFRISPNHANQATYISNQLNMLHIWTMYNPTDKCLIYIWQWVSRSCNAIGCYTIDWQVSFIPHHGDAFQSVWYCDWSIPDGKGGNSEGVCQGGFVWM